MMKVIRRILIVGILVAGLVVAVTKFTEWRSRTIQKQHDQYLTDLSSPSAQRRLSAADNLLEISPTNALRITRAEALLELNRHPDARTELEYVISKDSIGNAATDVEKIQVMVLDSYLAEARLEVLTLDAREPVLTLERVEILMQGVEIRLNKIVGPNGKRLARNYNLRRLDVLARTLQTVLATKRIELAIAEESGINESIQTVGFEVQEMDKRLKAIDGNLEEACKTAIKENADNAAAIEILFAYALRHRDMGKTHEAVRQLIALPELDKAVAGRTADTLLTIEVGHQQTLTSKEVELARQLLQHPKLTGKRSIQYEFANIRIANESNQPEQAEERARDAIARRFSHPRLRCELATAFIAQGKPDSAVSVIQQLGDTSNLAECQYVLGLALLAKGGRSSAMGMDALRHCVELKPEHLPARLKLIEAMVLAGFPDQARNDVTFIQRLNPNHPRVEAQASKIAVLSENMRELATITAEGLRSLGSTPSVDDHLLVASMLLDDVQNVRVILERRKQAGNGNSLTLIADPWLDAPAQRRVPMACAVGRGMLDVIDSDPMMRAQPRPGPAVGSLALSEDNAGKKHQRPLGQLRFVPSPSDLAIEIAERGLDAWQHDANLIQVLIEANLWASDLAAVRDNLRQLPPATDTSSVTLAIVRAYANDDSEKLTELLKKTAAKSEFDSATVELIRIAIAYKAQDVQTTSQSLQQILTNHPWAAEAVFVILRESIDQSQPDKAYSWLGQVQLLNPELAHFARAKLNLVFNKPADAITEATAMISNELPQSELRRWSADVRAMAFAQMDQPLLAVSTFDQLQLSLREHRFEIRLNSADVLAEMGKTSGATEILSRLLARSLNKPDMIDRMLSRAVLVMKPNQIKAMIETLLSYNPNDTMLLLYQAKLSADEDHLVAERRFKNVMAKRKGAPRALMEWAKFNRSFQPDESVRVYRQLAKRGGSIGAIARRELNEILMANAEDLKPSDD